MTGSHTMPAESAVRILAALAQEDVDACVGGGWAVDALLEKQTRRHSDLDLWVAAPNFEAMIVALQRLGVDRIFPWPGDRPWNFVLHDGGRLRVDLHLYESLAGGSLHYGSVRTGVVFPAGALDGRGLLAGTPIRCEAPEWSVRWHSTYPPRAVDRHDVPLLCERFGIDLPEVFAERPADEPPGAGPPG